METQMIKGSEALVRSLINEGVDTVFGYPGGVIMPVFDTLYVFSDQINHILVRHEQGATHAAEGYARVSGKPGVVIVTSGPGATNIITGLTDAMIDSTPMIIITGQVPTHLLGTDAFQEADVVGITQPISKWSYQIRHAHEIPMAVARAFYIAANGRPGPVVLDLTKTAQIEMLDYQYQKCTYIRSYHPIPIANPVDIINAADVINNAERPLLLVGQGVILSNAEEEVIALIEKADIPFGSTLLGLSAIPSDHPLNKGMIGMHGYIAPNIKTNECDVLIAIGMRFDDRVTGDLKTYAKQAKIIHIDIDPSELNKNVKNYVSILGDAKGSLAELNKLIKPAYHPEWIAGFEHCETVEQERIIDKELYPSEGPLSMGEVVRKVTEATENEAIVVTDVGQHQMFSARYFKYTKTRSMVTSGGLGTMGFGLPAAIGAKIGAPDRTVCLFSGDGGIQMTIQELGVIMSTGVNIKIIILNNNFLGMVRQWQELFFDERYSHTEMINPDFVMLAAAYGVKGAKVSQRESLDQAIQEMLEHDGSYLLDVSVVEKGLIFPMIPSGATVTNIMLNHTEKYEYPQQHLMQTISKQS